MNAEQNVAYLQAMLGCATIEMHAMLAANKTCELNGWAPAYGEAAFNDLIEHYGIHHNAVMTLLVGE